ncbi:GNAT family N-acetyltransferase [Alicyclobacillus sendaiensis]|uniref:GNAT family N-acetyltransferase n=1 Tax=Alicyclobacillus sendaiensis PA2 TaxID=3029425 RepID=A0ABT6XXP9_ALISE|nr:GNAT family N-acetyltransferase [Alicyclobacillus sendaiensis]MDI9259562.1 GNAT family N-acetyltransferase [Alicyclobacillus sendaiensis PA2]
MPHRPYRLRVNDWSALEDLYLRFADDPGWPHEARARRAWEHLVQTWQVGAWLGDAQVAVADHGGEPVGFAAVTLALDEPQLGRAMEVGTFVAPAHRGRGANEVLKIWSTQAAVRLGAAWLTACIPVRNARARRAFVKVFPGAEVYENPESAGPWREYLKRRAFAAGEPVRLYVVHLSNFSHPR